MFIFLPLLLISLIFALAVSYYLRNWNRALAVELRFSRECLFEGEKGSIDQIVTNRKLLPFWWGDIRYTIPGFITVRDPGYIGREYFKDTVSAFSYERVCKSVDFTASARGYYRIGEAELVTQDFLYRYRMIQSFPVSAELYVFPALRDAGRFEVEFRRITGEVIARRHMIEDPFQFRGIRDYSPFDSLKKVNWSATAKTGDMKVNEYACTSSQEVVLLLDFDRRTDWDPRELWEDVIRIAAGLAGKLIAAGVPVGLMTNACDTVTGEEVHVRCRNGSGHLETLYRRCARLDTGRLSRPFDDILSGLPAGRPDAPQYILISLDAGDALAAAAGRLRAEGSGLQWVLVREKSAKPLARREGQIICEVDR